MSCSTSTTVTPDCATLRIKASISPVSVWFRPAAGSSSSSTFGLAASARAISRRFNAPYDICPASSSMCRPTPTNSIRPAASSRQAASARRTDGKRSMEANRFWFRRRCAPTMTLSIAVMFMHTCRFWKVRLMPRRASASGGMAATFSPLSKISPLVGVYTPVIKLNKVVLPAPFGPITEWILPSLTLKLTSCTACTPPKLLLRLLIVSISDLLCRFRRYFRRSRTLARTAGQARYETLGHENHGRHQDHAEHHRFPAFKTGQQLRQDRQQRCADDGAEDRCHAAHHHHHHQLDRVEETGQVGGDETDVMGADAARNAGNDGRQHEHAHLEARRIDADHAGRHFRTVDRLQRAADGRIDQVQGQPGDEHQQHGAHQVPRFFTGDFQAGDTEGRDADAIGAARPLRFVVDDDGNDDAQAQGGHGQGMALEF